MCRMFFQISYQSRARTDAQDIFHRMELVRTGDIVRDGIGIGTKVPTLTKITDHIFKLD